MKTRARMRDGDATRRLLVDAAAKLFASSGVDAVSIRAVNAEAGQGPASVHYHFGSKDALIAAVLLQEGTAVLARIRELAAHLAARPEPPSARQLIDLMAVAYRELLERDPVRGSRWLAVSGQLSLADDDRLFSTSGDTKDVLGQLLARAYPHAEPAVRELNWTLAVNMLIVMIGRWASSASIESAVAPIRQFEALVVFVSGGLDRAITARMASV